MCNKILRVLQVTGAMNRGGAEVMLMDIYRNLPPDVRFDFLINCKIKDPKPHGDFDDEIIRLGGRLRHIGTQWDLGILKYISQFKRIVDDIGKPDVVHIHLNSKCGGIALAARLCGIKKIIAHSHEISALKGSFLEIIVRTLEITFQKMLIALCATDYWGCSTGALERLYYKWIIRKRKAVVIKNAINVLAFLSVAENVSTEIRRTYRHREDTIVIGNVGQVIRIKNLSFIIEILRILDTNDIDFVFVFAGRVVDKDYMNEIMVTVNKYHIAEKVLYLGARDDIPTVMSTFDVFVAPNQSEGFGMVAVEAQAAGVPCILSTGFPPDVDMGLNLVTVVDNFDPESWADAVLRVKGNKCANKELIYQQIAERGFDAKNNAKHIEQLYRS